MKTVRTHSIVMAVIFTIIVFTVPAAAQEQTIKRITFKDGTIITGTVIKMNTATIEMRTGDGKTVTSGFDDIASIEEPTAAQAVAGGNPSHSLLHTHNYRIGLTGHYYDYEEPGFMELEGFMYGLVGNYTYHGTCGIMIAVDLEYSYGGDHTYKGRTWAGTPLETNDTDVWMFEGRAVLGHDFIIQRKSVITPFAGIGYHYLNTDNSKIPGSGGYEREIHYTYTPIGIQTVSPLSQKWTWGLKGEYDYFWGGRVESHLSNAVSGYNDPVNTEDRGDGYGIRVSLEFKRMVTEGHAYTVEFFYRKWDVNRSDLVPLTLNGTPTGTLVYEPGNNTDTYGIRVGVEF